jgi:hypothetical protein
MNGLRTEWAEKALALVANPRSPGARRHARFHALNLPLLADRGASVGARSIQIALRQLMQEMGAMGDGDMAAHVCNAIAELAKALRADEKALAKKTDAPPVRYNPGVDDT